MFSSLELKQYLPPLDELMTKLDEVNAFCQGQIAAMESLGPQDAKIRFIGNLPVLLWISFLYSLSAFQRRQLGVTLFLFSRDPDHLASVWFQQLHGPEGQPERLSFSMYDQHQPRGGAVHQFQESGTLKKKALPSIPFKFFSWLFCHQLPATYACCVEMALLQICQCFFFPT